MAGGGGFPASEPGIDVEHLLTGLLVGDELEVEIQVLEVAGERSPGSFDLDHFGSDLDLYAVGDIHGVGGENRLHFFVTRLPGVKNKTLAMPEFDFDAITGIYCIRLT